MEICRLVDNDGGITVLSPPEGTKTQMNHSRNEKPKPQLKVILSAEVEQSVETAVASKLAQAEEHIVNRIFERLHPAATQTTTLPPSQPIRKFFDPLAGP
jgi:hypothetical protein